MRFSTRNAALAGVLAAGLLTFGMNPAKAQGYGGYAPVYSQGYYGGAT